MNWKLHIAGKAEKVGLLKKNELSSTNSWHVGENANCWCCCQVSKNESVIVSIEISSKELDSHRNSSWSILNRSRVSLFLTLFIVTGKRCPRKETRNPFVIPTVTWPTEPVWHNTCFCAALVRPHLQFPSILPQIHRVRMRSTDSKHRHWYTHRHTHNLLPPPAN